MNIDGTNTLACTKNLDDVRGDVAVYPLPHRPVVKDLVLDLNQPYSQLASIEPRSRPTARRPRERYQSVEDRAKLDGLWECILCFVLDSLSVYQERDRYLGPAIRRRRTAGSRTAAMRQLGSGSTRSKTHSDFTAVIPL